MEDPIDQEQLAVDAAVDEFWAVRGRAIQCYASVEQALCLVFAYLTGMPIDVAGIIFFKIVNVGTLYGILEKLLRKKHGDTYSLFWNSLLKFLRGEVSEMRNQIVHWNVVHLVKDDEFIGLGLSPPNIYDTSPNAPPPITTQKLREFMYKCYFCERLSIMFHAIHDPEESAKMDAGQVQTWRDIFLQPITYPPPDTHPLSPKMQAPESPPPPSQV